MKISSYTKIGGYWLLGTSLVVGLMVCAGTCAPRSEIAEKWSMTYMNNLRLPFDGIACGGLCTDLFRGGADYTRCIIRTGTGTRTLCCTWGVGLAPEGCVAP